jgi:hypothetical protein
MHSIVALQVPALDHHPVMFSNAWTQPQEKYQVGTVGRQISGILFSAVRQDQ